MSTKLGILPAKGSVELYSKLHTLAKIAYDACNCWMYIQRKGKSKFITELNAYMDTDDISTAMQLFTSDFPQIDIEQYNLLLDVLSIFGYAYKEETHYTFIVSILTALADPETEDVPDIAKSVANHLTTSSPLNIADTTYIQPSGMVLKLPSYSHFVAFMTVVLPTLSDYFDGNVDTFTFAKDKNLPSLRTFMESNYVSAEAFKI